MGLQLLTTHIVRLGWLYMYLLRAQGAAGPCCGEGLGAALTLA